jgi:hypothetical protein
MPPSVKGYCVEGLCLQPFAVANDYCLHVLVPKCLQTLQNWALLQEKLLAKEPGCVGQLQSIQDCAERIACRLNE